ncbi:chromosome partitioning protein ParB [Puniceibacterium sp. HSS470]|nr:chromosome partitioning protein ParB [Puniceibacterium sp. HSS470]|tara:strand:- start:27188 stop:28039 length:852 start_codon:yes stop_codon:yes gene_type:complete
MSKPRLMQKTRVRVEEIDASQRLRPVSEAGIESLVGSIAELGLMKDAIHVRQKKNGQLVLIAGGHRLEVAKRLGWQEIEAKVWTDVTDDWARLMEVDDNLAGAEMNALDTAVFLAERKRLYQKLHPETKAGVAGGLARQGLASDILSFAASTADKFGVSKRQVERMVAAGERLAPDEIQRLRRAPRAVAMADLQVIGQLGPAERYAIVDALAGGTAKSAAKALSAIKAKAQGKEAAQPDPNEQAYRALMDAWKRAPATARRRFLDECGQDVSALMPKPHVVAG